MLDLAAHLQLVCVIGTCAATFFGCLSIWSCAGQFRWYWHIAPLSLALAALIPMGGHEPVLLFGSQAATVVLADLVSRDIARRSLRKDTSSSLRFGLGDLIVAVAIVACIAAIARRLPVLGTPHVVIAWWRWMITGFGFGLATCAAEVLVRGRWRWYGRVAGSGALASMGIAAVLLGDPKEAIYHYGNWGAYQVSWSAEWAIALILSQIALTVAWLLLLKRASWAWWRASSPSTISHVYATKRTKHRRVATIAARLLWCAASIFLTVAIADLYLGLLPALTVPQVDLPVPNGYDDMLRASRLLNWKAIPIQDVDAASDQECVQFSQDNARSFALLRDSFSKQWKIPVDYNNTSNSLDGLNLARALCLALDAEAKGFLAIGRRDDAIRSYVDMVYLGSAFASGGLVNEELVADSLIGVGLARMANELPTLDPPMLAEVTFALQVPENVREPVDAIIARDRIANLLSMGWTGRLNQFAWDTVYGDSASITAIHHSRRKADVQLHLIIAETAVRRYQRLNGSPPPSLEALVPEYLDRVPRDPFDPYDLGTLVYRPNGKTYLLYSIGGDGRDDGGQRQPVRDAMYGEKSDLFFDTSPN
jgi:hypothetical protein